ncbi:MAG TPA: hypothetical protein QGH92_01555, partial [Candidatus Parcubacteria bacterium]|nr:hypothetical protein [Candidatus Parcubacteria bacterium]
MLKGNSENYISLQEATKYCNYSQEYLSLRARKGKLRALKFGRNWVTKKEWLNEYLDKIKEYNGKINHQEVVKAESVGPPENLPVAKEEITEDQLVEIPRLRFGFALALVFVLITAGTVFGKESLQSVFKDISPIVQKATHQLSEVTLDLQTAQSATSLFKGYGSWMSKQPSKITETYQKTDQYLDEKIFGLKDIKLPKLAIPRPSIPRFSIPVPSIPRPDFTVFRDRTSDIVKSYFAIDSSLDTKIVQGANKIKDSYLAADRFTDKKFLDLGKEISKGYLVVKKTLVGETQELEQVFVSGQEIINKLASGLKVRVFGFGDFVIQPWKGPLIERVAVGERVEKEEFEELRQELERLKETPFVVKEVITERKEVTELQPITEVTKEIVKVYEKALADFTVFRDRTSDIVKSYFAIDSSLDTKIVQGANKIKDSYLAA